MLHSKVKVRARDFDPKVPRDICVAAAIFTIIFSVFGRPAMADAWIPAAGTGDFKWMLRYSFADSSFDPNTFSQQTHPSTKEHATQIRLTGVHGLGYGLALDYDLRYGFLYQSKTKKGITAINTNNGLQDQRLGLDYGLTQNTNFADAVGLSIIYPGGPSGTHPALDCGQWAMEPDYLIGFKPGFADLTANLKVGVRLFFDGGVTQFRTHFELSEPLIHGVRLMEKVLFVRSMRMRGYNDLRDRGERYDVLRVGLGLEFHLTKNIEPIMAYDVDVAGARKHASHRFMVGLKMKY